MSEDRWMGTLHYRDGVEEQRQPGTLWSDLAAHQYQHHLTHCQGSFLQLHMTILNITSTLMLCNSQFLLEFTTQVTVYTLRVDGPRPRPEALLVDKMYAAILVPHTGETPSCSCTYIQVTVRLLMVDGRP